MYVQLKSPYPLDRALIVVCPYGENTFDTAEGHVCLELIKLSEPAQ